jgi:heme/copper-type cytochrome/quinol oxidase subunit 2
MEKEIKRHEEKEDNLIAIIVSISVFVALLMIGFGIYFYRLRREKPSKYEKPASDNELH